MPYVDPAVRRAYNREWLRKNPPTASGALCREIEQALTDVGRPLGPKEIVTLIGRSNRNSVSVSLHRLKAEGRVKNQVYGQWVIA